MNLEKENKTWQLKCRFTPAEKEKIFKYCEEHDMSISDFVRLAINRVFEKAKFD